MKYTTLGPAAAIAAVRRIADQRVTLFGTAVRRCIP
jgi:hypothetical protein